MIGTGLTLSLLITSLFTLTSLLTSPTEFCSYKYITLLFLGLDVCSFVYLIILSNATIVNLLGNFLLKNSTWSAVN
jgi:hypothetical protein